VQKDGEVRTLSPKHIVMAPGAFGTVPNIPSIPGLDTFGGSVVHTSQYHDGQPYAGLDVAIVGTGASGHDTAVEVHNSGGRVTLLQRSPVKVIDIETNSRFPWAPYPAGASIEEIDLLTAANIVFPLAREAIGRNAARQAEADAALLAGLESAGFKVDRDVSDGGWQLDAWRWGAGYYINVGASNLIAEGQIGVLQMEQVARFVPEGVELVDGGTREFDAVILATGYHNASVDIARLFGEEVASRIEGGIWNLDDRGTGEWSNTWCPTGQDNLWFNAGAFPQARFYSHLLALQIKARLDGLPTQ
jgi:putative flavoprotein involved in K+ transport